MPCDSIISTADPKIRSILAVTKNRRRIFDLKHCDECGPLKRKVGPDDIARFRGLAILMRPGF